MPQRVLHAWMIVVGIIGLVLAAALLLFGADLHRASRTGPRWKRRLLTAALALLGGAGVYVVGKAAQAAGAAAPKAAVGATKTPLDRTAQWQRLTATWKQADDVASGRKGPYPFDRKGQKSLLADLEARARDIDALAATGLLSAAEGALLKKELDRLAGGVRAKRPTELKMATCYEPTWQHAAADESLRRIADRLALLARIAEAPSLRPEVTGKILATLEADLARARSAAYLKHLKEQTARLNDPKTSKHAERFMAAAHRRDAEKHIQAARALAAKIKARLAGPAAEPAPGLETTAQWKTVLEAWRFAKPLADSHKSTTAQRKQADKKFADAKQAVVALANAGAISPAEGGLLAAEADTLRGEIYRNPPIDSRVKCYETMYIPPARASFSRLQKRLPLLRQTVEGGKVSPAVVAKVLPTIRADLATLADPKQTAKLQPQRKAQLDKLVADTKAAVVKIEKMLEGRK